MDNEIRATVDSLCTTVKTVDGRVSELQNQVKDNENQATSDLSYTKDCLRDMDKKFAELQQDHEKLGDRVNKAMLYICGVFAGMHYPAAAEGLKEICGFEKKE